MRAGYCFAFLVACATSTACTVHGTDVPAPTGPSELALSLTVTVTPDTLVQDGQAQTTVVVSAFDVNGKGKSGQMVTLDTEVLTGLSWTRHEFGTLSSRLLTTGSDGRASATFTVPTIAKAGFEQRVRIVARTVGSDNSGTSERAAELRLIPPAGYQAPGPIPRPDFFFSPTPIVVNAPVAFNATASCPETPAEDMPCTSSLTITSYIWDFGDGNTEEGSWTDHIYRAEGTYTVTLRVINSRGVQAVLSKTVDVKLPAPPTATFVVSPSPFSVGRLLTFNASLSTAAPGRTIVSYAWSFGDGGGGTGVIAQRAFAAVGTYNVVLTVTDDTGQKASSSVAVTVVP